MGAYRLLIIFTDADLLEQLKDKIFTIGHIFANQLLCNVHYALECLLSEQLEVDLDQSTKLKDHIAEVVSDYGRQFLEEDLVRLLVKSTLRCH